uniref:hypothetical protein n=1 Tax=Polaribacter sp. TaxID=1920175 RepID=UPI00404849FD
MLRLSVVIIFLSTILLPQLKLVGLYFTGMDYMVYFIFLILIPLKGKLYYEKAVINKIFLIVLIGGVSLATSKYIKNYFLSILGFLIILLPFVSYFLFYNIKSNEKTIISLFKSIQGLLFLVALSILINFVLGRTNLYGNPLSITKDIGFAATLCNINIIVSLALYGYSKAKRHLVIIAACLVAILLTSALKSIIMSVIVLLYFLSTQDLHKYIKKIMYVGVISFFAITVFSNQFIQEKVKFYFYLYITSDNSLEIARTASYIASVNIAIDHFPLGSGPGTFGSYPVLITYNDLYYDYNLSNVWGLQEENLKDPSLPSFILDTYWPSPMAEIGIIGVLVLLSLFLYPVLRLKKLTRNEVLQNNTLVKYLKFYVFALALVLFVENITLSSLSQVSIIILYFGFSGLIISYIEKIE